ncbi:MAG: outer membrane lipoprotein-sorting protein [Maricaulaceae bacterium]
MRKTPPSPLKPILAAAGALALIGFAALAEAQTPEEQGYAVAERANASDNGFGDSRVDAKMILRNAAGDATQRDLTFTTLERESVEVGDKSLVVFHSPRDVEGTALLSHAKILDPDDQWLFLPALKRTKRISSANKSGPFVGSEFAFEDFTALELGKYDYKYLREDTLGDLTVDVVERYPLYEKSGYTRQVSYIDQDIHQVRKVEFFDRRGDLLKTLSLEDYRPYEVTTPEGETVQVWRSHAFLMVNHKTGKETDLIYEDYAFEAGLNDRDFTRSVLERAR